MNESPARLPDSSGPGVRCIISGLRQYKAFLGGIAGRTRRSADAVQKTSVYQSEKARVHVSDERDGVTEFDRECSSGRGAGGRYSKSTLIGGRKTTAGSPLNQ